MKQETKEILLNTIKNNDVEQNKELLDRYNLEFESIKQTTRKLSDKLKLVDSKIENDLYSFFKVESKLQIHVSTDIVPSYYRKSYEQDLNISSTKIKIIVENSKTNQSCDVDYDSYDESISIDSINRNTKKENSERIDMLLIAAKIMSEKEAINQIIQTYFDSELFDKYCVALNDFYDISYLIEKINSTIEAYSHEQLKLEILEKIKASKYFFESDLRYYNAKRYWYRIDKVTDKNVICTHMYKSYSVKDDRDVWFGQNRHIKIDSFVNDVIGNYYHLQDDYNELIQL